jgi:uncharacterized protein DUF6788
LPRNEFPDAERRRRSRIAKLAHYSKVLRGTLSVRKNTCGKPNCCCTRGEPHIALYLVQSQKGKPRQLFIPKTWEQRVRQAVTDYQELQKLVEELSEIEWKHVENREE